MLKSTQSYILMLGSFAICNGIQDLMDVSVKTSTSLQVIIS